MRRNEARGKLLRLDVVGPNGLVLKFRIKEKLVADGEKVEVVVGLDVFLVVAGVGFQLTEDDGVAVALIVGADAPPEDDLVLKT